MARHNIMPDLVAWLTAQLGVRVSTQVPTERVSPPADTRLVTISRTGTWTTGTTRHTNVDRPVLTFTCWGADDLEANKLCDEVEGLMDGAEEALSRVTFCEQSTKYQAVGPKGERQWVLTCVLVVR